MTNMNDGHIIDAVEDVDEAYVRHITIAKERDSVAKIQFAEFASTICENDKIFAYEGRDDKIVYYYWVRRLRHGLAYTPYVCKNKAKTLQLFDSLKEDKTGLIERVYFFVDHDFDGLQGRNADPRIFVTDMYSVENYVVNVKVVDDLLQIDFHCGSKDMRDVVIDLFEKDYASFLALMKECNYRIYLSRTCRIEQLGDLPNRINQLANVSLGNVTRGDCNPEDLVLLIREPTPSEFSEKRSDFEKLSPSDHYRGKFAIVFFAKWLELLRKERLSESSDLFSGIPLPEFSIKGDFSFETLAPKSELPVDLSKFILSIS
jgi:hypothetical protein